MRDKRTPKDVCGEAKLAPDKLLIFQQVEELQSNSHYCNPLLLLIQYHKKLVSIYSTNWYQCVMLQLKLLSC